MVPEVGALGRARVHHYVLRRRNELEVSREVSRPLYKLEPANRLLLVKENVIL